MPGTGIAFERPEDLGRNPASIESAGLRRDVFAIDVTIDTPGIEGDVIFDHVESWPGSWIAPGDRLFRFASQCPIFRHSFPLADRRAVCLDELVRTTQCNGPESVRLERPSGHHQRERTLVLRLRRSSERALQRWDPVRCSTVAPNPRPRSIFASDGAFEELGVERDLPKFRTVDHLKSAGETTWHQIEGPRVILPGEHDLEKYARTMSPSIGFDGRRRVLEGDTTLEEVLRVTRED